MTTILTATELSALVNELLPVATLDDLRELAKPDNQAQITVQGGDEAGDGLGGDFWFDTDATDNDDGTDIIAPDEGGAGRWRRISADRPLVIDNRADADLTDALIIKAGLTANKRRYISWADYNGDITMMLGNNAEKCFIVFDQVEDHHWITAEPESEGGIFNINASFGGVVQFNAEANSGNGVNFFDGDPVTPVREVAIGNNGVRIFNDGLLGGVGFGANGSSTVDAGLVRDAASALAVRTIGDGTTGQTLRLYGHFTNTSTNYQRSAWQVAKQTLSAMSGATVTCTGLIPDGAFLLGVTTRVNTALGTGNGTTGYSVGDGSDADLWGTKSAVAAGTATQSADFTSTAACGLYISAQNVVITALTGNFDGTGEMEVIAHYMRCEAT